MTVLFSTDFESNSDYQIPSGWQAGGGGTSPWLVRDVPSIATNGTKVLTSPGSSAGTPAEFVGLADRTTVEYEFRQKAAIDGSNQYIIGVAHTDHIIGNPTDFNYRFLFTATTSSVTADISPFIGGSFPGVLGTGTRAMPTSAGDIIGVKVRVENKIASVWVWNASHESMPASPLATWTDTVQRAAGHFGCYWMNGGVVLLGLDQFSISDGATAGGTNATATGATLTGTSSLSAGSASGGSGSSSATAPGATLTGSSSLSAGTATGGASGGFSSSPMENSAGSLLASTTVLWEWRKGAGVGVAPASVTYGSGTTNASGVLVLTGLPVGAGELLAATADYAHVYYERGTVS